MKKYSYIILLILFVISIGLWSVLFDQPNPDLLEVNFFDVGQGDGIFIKCCGDRQVLIDGGPNATVLEKLGTEMNFFDRYIDIVVLTHPDADHLNGLLEVMKIFDVGLVLTSGLEKDTETYRIWQNLLQEKQIPVRQAQAGQVIELNEDIFFEVLWPEKGIDISPEKANEYSVVLRLVYDMASFLLTGDIEKKAELALANKDIKTDVLKVAHHGSRGSTNPLFLQKANPQIAVISVGENSYGHPHAEVLERLSGIALYRTDLHHDIEIITDGQRFQISTAQ